MVDYLETGKWNSPRDALPEDFKEVLAYTGGRPVVAYIKSDVWYCNDFLGVRAQTIGSPQAVDRWMHIPPVQPQPEVQVLVEATGASIDELTLRRENTHRVGEPLEPVIFYGARPLRGCL